MYFQKYYNVPMTTKYDSQKMRDRILSVMEERGLSMRKVSLESGNSESYLSGVLTRGRDPQLAKLINVCEHLDISVTWALYGFEVPDGADEIFQLLAERPDLAGSVASLLRGQSEVAAQG